MYTVRIFMKCTHVYAAQKAYNLFIKLQIKPDFHSLADEIAEQRPDMNVKVADTVTVDRYILRDFRNATPTTLYIF